MPYELNKNNPQDARLLELLSVPHLRTFKDTGCIPSAIADKIFPYFCKGYFTRLLTRKRIEGIRIGRQFFVNYKQARDYVRPVPVTAEAEVIREPGDSLGLGL